MLPTFKIIMQENYRFRIYTEFGTYRECDNTQLTKTIADVMRDYGEAIINMAEHVHAKSK